MKLRVVWIALVGAMAGCGTDAPSSGGGDGASCRAEGESCSAHADCCEDLLCDNATTCVAPLNREDQAGGGADPGEPESPMPPTAPEHAAEIPLGDIQASTWLVIVVGDSSTPLATAFAVAPDLLATNAHVVEAIVGLYSEPNASVVVVQHETGAWLNIETVWSHPLYVSDFFELTPDVGLLQVDDRMRSFIALADTETLQSLAVFDEVSLCGFPGGLPSDIDLLGLSLGGFRPRATCLAGTISALRPFNPAQAATPANTRLLQYDMPTIQGMSGSAVVDEAGVVVGVHAFGALEGDFNFAVRADSLAELLNWAVQGDLLGTRLVIH